MPHTRTFGLPAVYIYIYTLKFLNCMTNSEEFVNIYIYIYITLAIFGCPVSGHRTPWLSQVKLYTFGLFVIKSKSFDETKS